MESIIKSIPGYKIYEYQLVLNPHEDLRDKIIKLKQDFFENYKSNSALYSPPQIILTRFIQYEMSEERITGRLKIIAMGYQPFKIELRDFGTFPTHTIFINVLSKLPIQQLVKAIRSEAQQLMKFDKDNKPHFMIDPYITVARKLQPWQYEKGWLDFSHRHFTGRFVADAMLLLRRPVGELKYQVVASYEFQNMPVATIQGALML